ncbi:MAG: spermidine synthase [Alphaproteobacteria bacterium]
MARPTVSSGAETQSRAVRLMLFAVAFLNGWIIMQIEILGGRVLAPFFGYSVYQWGALIGIVMAALSVGYYIGGRVGDRPSAKSFLLGATLLSLIYIVAMTFLAESILPSLRAVGPAWGAVIASTVLLGVPSILLATTSPIVIRLTATNLIANSAGKVYMVSTIGSIGGTFFTTFFAIPELGSRTSHLVAAGLTAASVILLAASMRDRKFAGAAVVAFAAAIGMQVAEGAKKEPGMLFTGESIYNIIKVQEAGNHRYLFLNYTDGAQTVMIKNQVLTGSYYDYFLLGPHLTGGKKVLFLGVAGGTSLKQLVDTYPDVEVTGVELDPAVVDIAKNYFFLKDHPRIKLVAEDARWFVSSTKEKYDVIALDLYVTGHVPFFTTTQEFFAVVRDRLTDNGVMMLNLLSARPGDELVGPFVRTIASQFPSVYLTNYGNFIVIGTKQKTTLAQLSEQLKKPGKTGDVDTVLRRTLGSIRDARVDAKWPMFTDDKNDVEFRTFRQFYGTY